MSKRGMPDFECSSVNDEPPAIKHRKLGRNSSETATTTSLSSCQDPYTKSLIKSDQIVSDEVRAFRAIPPSSSLRPWTTASIPSVIPKLPAICDEALECATFTHAGAITHNRPTSYERLEWVGDAYLQLTATLLVSQSFLTCTPGQCSQIRELIVKNKTLAGYARQYGFEKRAVLPVEFSTGGRATETERVKVLGDIFEAYVAAVIYSDAQHGVERITLWLRDLWAITLADKIKANERHAQEVKLMNTGAEGIPAKTQLANLVVSKGIRLEYKDSAPAQVDRQTKQLIYTIGVYLTGWNEDNKLLATGTGLSKKIAGVKAAETALQQHITLQKYHDMKKAHDKKVAMEREAREASNQI